MKCDTILMREIVVRFQTDFETYLTVDDGSVVFTKRLHPAKEGEKIDIPVMVMQTILERSNDFVAGFINIGEETGVLHMRYTSPTSLMVDQGQITITREKDVPSEDHQDS